MDKKSTTNLIRTPRVSFFDICDTKAGVFGCQMKGFYSFFTLMTGIYVGISATLRFMSEGKLIESFFLEEMVNDFHIVLVAWPLFFLYSWFTFMIQRLVVQGMPVQIGMALYYLSQIWMFVFSIQTILGRNMGFSQTVYIIFLAFTHFMKMHSYIHVNRDLHESMIKSSYPSNVTMKNYFEYLVAPVLVYQLEYPRTESIRISYFLKKSLLMFSRLCFMYVIASENIIPHILTASSLKFIELFDALMFPLVLEFCMLFLVLFDDILNLFAEISMLADRGFYRDWWNATNFDEFNRKWNVPVHLFLFKHVYSECIDRYGMSPSSAKVSTFLFSAFCHELMCFLIFKRYIPIITFFMMMQTPITLFQKFMKNDLFENYLVWVGLITGLSLIISSYIHF